MRFMLIARPQFPIPPEQFPALVQGFQAWWDRYRDRWEVAGFFAGGGGGGGITTATDEVAFHQMMVEWPFSPFSEIEAHALVEPDTALRQWQEALQAMGGQG